jgi:hypothetical protein
MLAHRMMGLGLVTGRYPLLVTSFSIIDFALKGRYKQMEWGLGFAKSRHNITKSRHNITKSRHNITKSRHYSQPSQRTKYFPSE